MDFNLKTYKHFRIKRYLRKKRFFFLFHGSTLKSKNWIKIEQTLASYQLRYFRVLNKLVVNILKNSIFKNLIILIHGPVILLNSNNVKLSVKNLKDISPFLCLLGVRLNYRIYSTKQIKNLKKMSYFENFLILHNSMQTCIKIPYYKFKNKKTLLMSK